MENNLIKIISSTGCFTCGYELKNFSITQNDFDDYIHGEIYKNIIEIATAVYLWSPPSDLKNHPNIHKISRNLYRLSSRDFLCDTKHHTYLNMLEGKRGSIAFLIDNSKWIDLVKIVSKSKLFGIPSSKTAVINEHGISSWKWAINQAALGNKVIMVGRQSGPENIDVFLPIRLMAKFMIDCIHERESKSFISSMWPTDEIKKLEIEIEAIK